MTWSNLSNVVYKRTYSRSDKGPLESWEKTTDRVIEGNIKKATELGHAPAIEEVNELRDFMLKRKAMPAGRGIWSSGSPNHDRIGGVALNNCWGITLDDIYNLVLAQDLLMLGGGVGASIEHKYVSKLPKVRKGSVTILHKNTKDADFIVPDSREGWNELLRKVLEAFFYTGKGFTYSTYVIRGHGSDIVGFGGKASGPGPLVRMVEKMCALLISRQGKHLRPIDAMDLLCCVGEMVVAGNVRRSAILILGDAWDKEYLKSKRWDLGNIPTERAMANLSINVEDMDDVHPLFWKTYENGEPFGIVNIKNINKYGRMGELKKDTAVIVNPCFTGDTKLLTSEGYRTFSELSLLGDNLQLVNYRGETVSGKVWSNGVKSIVQLKLTTGDTIRCTPDHVFMVEGDLECKAENLLGKGLKTHENAQRAVVCSISLAGKEEVFDFTLRDDTHWGVVKTNGEVGVVAHNCAEATLEDGEPCNLQEIFMSNITDVKEFIRAGQLMHRYGKRVTLEDYHHDKIQKVIQRNRRVGTGITGCLQSPLFTPDVLDEVYAAIQQENVSYSKELGIQESVRTTVIKPSGTLSLMGDCTPGIHPSYSRFYIRRVRFSSTDKLIPLLKAAGHYMEPVKRFDGTLDHSTMVVDFYCKTPEGTPTADEGFDTWKQLDVVKLAQKHWADQSVSVTVYYRKEELAELKEWLKNNLKYLKTISFLCHSDHGFDQAPLEGITEDMYNKLSPKITPIDVDSINGGDIIDEECEGGVCPIR